MNYATFQRNHVTIQLITDIKFAHIWPKMARPFRYVFEDSLYLGFSEAMPLNDGRKVFGITCPDFNSYFEVIETGIHSSPYLPKAANYFNPFSQTVLEWFCDDRLLYE